MKYFHIIIWFHLVCIVNACSQTPAKEEKQQRDSITRVNYSMEEKAALIAKHKDVWNFFKINKDGISIYESLEKKQAGIAEYTLFNTEFEYFKYLVYNFPVDSVVKKMLKKGNKPFKNTEIPTNNSEEKKDSSLLLSGFRIALDPGHVAGDIQTAKLEDRIIQIVQKNGDTLRFYEAKLAYACTRFLEDTLKKLGAEVFLTRTANGNTAFGMSFDQWMKTRLKDAVANEVKRKNITQSAANRYLANPKKRDVFHNLFSRLDMEERANRINAFKPNLTLVVHFNIDEDNYRKNLNKPTLDFTTKNYSMVFVPGSFSSAKLDKPRKRFEILRLLVTDDIKTSVEFSKIAEEQFQKLLGISPVDNKLNVRYLSDNCIYMNFPGVYARNLALTNLINGTIAYGETLLQDNVNEAKELVNEEIPIGGIKSNKRMKEVAISFLDAILVFYGKK